MSAIAMQWEVVLKIPIDTWPPTHKQGHRQTHTSRWPKRCHSCTTAHGNTHKSTETQILHNLDTQKRLKYIKSSLLFTVLLNYKILNPSEFTLAVLCVLERAMSGPFHTQAQVLCANKPSCHIVTLGRRNMGKLLCTHCIECLLWQILFFSLPHADTLLGQFAESWSPEQKSLLTEQLPVLGVVTGWVFLCQWFVSTVVQMDLWTLSTCQDWQTKIWPEGTLKSVCARMSPAVCQQKLVLNNCGLDRLYVL